MKSKIIFPQMKICAPKIRIENATTIQKETHDLGRMEKLKKKLKFNDKKVQAPRFPCDFPSPPRRIQCQQCAQQSRARTLTNKKKGF